MSAESILIRRLPGKLGKVPLLIRHLGWRGAVAYLLRRTATFVAGETHQPTPKNNVLEFYDFLIRQAPASLADPSRIPERTMNWVIPHFEIGSGGHMTAFRMLHLLEQRGYRCRIIMVGPTHYTDPITLTRTIRKHFVPVQAEATIGEESLQAAEFTVATSWDTAYAVRRFAATRHKLYFVQDMEPFFYSHGSVYAFAEATYTFGFIGITAGDWLAQTMRDQYGMEAYPFGFSYDKSQHTLKPRKPGPRRVLLYARSVTPRRGFELGLLTLQLVHQALPEIEFVLVGWDASMYEIPFKHINPGVVPAARLPDYYRLCDAALVLSLTNLSLLPLELMACGCPVVSNAGPNVEWQLKHEQNALLAPATPEDLATALIRLLSDETLRQRLISKGLAFAQATDWNHEVERVYHCLEQIRSREC